MGHGFSVMWKTVSNDCNMACDYCYFSGSTGVKPEDYRVQPALLETFMSNFMAGTDGVASLAWQGGEPLLAGHEFFEEVVGLQLKYAPPRTVISNAIQTNGTLIDERWARFFKKYNFLVGVSIDGSASIHNERRRMGSGQGSFEAVMRGVRWLRAYQVDFNILSVIHEGNVGRADELMDFYRKEQFPYIQFIPCMDFKAQETGKQGSYAINPGQYGQFLCDTFDGWWNGGKPESSIRVFDNLLSQYLHHRAELCVHSPTCPRTLIIESNGDVYPCDFYMSAECRLGNVVVNTFSELAEHPAWDRFAKLKGILPDSCKSCEYLHLCQGGCPRNRRWAGDEVMGADYFCSSYRMLYAYAHDRMEQLAASIRTDWKRQWAQKGKVLPSRNELCFCGSGLKYKKCCECPVGRNEYRKSSNRRSE